MRTARKFEKITGGYWFYHTKDGWYYTEDKSQKESYVKDLRKMVYMGANSKEAFINAKKLVEVRNLAEKVKNQCYNCGEILQGKETTLCQNCQDIENEMTKAGDFGLSIEEYSQKVLNRNIESGDYVDFGSYGKLYVCFEDGVNFWVTDEEKDRGKYQAPGWFINKKHAEKLIEKGKNP